MSLPGFKSQFFRQIAVAICCLVGVGSARAAGVEVPVPRVTIYPGQVIEEQMLVARAYRSGAGVQDFAASSSDALIGKVARQTLLPGHPIALNAIREPYAVTQGESALIMFKSGALTITATGLALQSGGTGDVVSVRNIDSGRTIQGTIGPDGVVHVSDQ